MTLVDRAIHALRTHHDLLAALVAELDEEGLAGPSGASEWSVGDVLSHLGSGAEIMLVPVAAGIGGVPVPGQDNQAVWDRFNAAAPSEQADWFVRHDARLVEALEGLSHEQRTDVRIDLGFLPEPVPLEVAVGIRLNEVALHTWDVQAGLDASATVDESAAEVLVELYAGSLGFLIGFSGHPDAIEEPAVVAALGHGLVVEDAVSVVNDPPVAPTARFVGDREAFVRLLGGRLRPAYTPEDVSVSGNVTLDDLRRVFPGY